MLSLNINFNTMYQQYSKFLSNQQDNHLYRKLFIHNLHNAIDFSSNDYLCLSKNKNIIQESCNATEIYGCGATGSRLLSGNYKIIEDFENIIAHDKKMEAALIFNSGYQANFATISTLIDKKILKNTALIFMDKSCHASMYNAILNHETHLKRFRHNDFAHLASLLEQVKNDSNPKFIFVESLYGMDGDFADMQYLQYLANKYDALLYIDESHSTGLYGENGFDFFYKTHKKIILMGTFSKAIGSSGGYIACDSLVKDYIINKAAGFIYSTAPSPAVIGASKAAWEMIYTMNNERREIKNTANYLREKLNQIKLDCLNSTSHIIPIIFKDPLKTQYAKEILQKNNIIVSAIKAPTVQPNKARIRIAINSSHNKNDIDKLIEILIMVAREGLEPPTHGL